MNKFLCFWFGHELVNKHDKDMFGREYVWQVIYCKRCGKRIN